MNCMPKLIGQDDTYGIFIYIINYENIDALDLLIDTCNKYDINYNIRQIFYTLVSGPDNIKLLDYFIKKFKYINFINYDIIELACMRKKSINVLKFMWDLGNKIDLHHDNDFLFIHSARYGHIDHIRWMFDIDEFAENICQDGKEEAFQYACSNGHLDIAKLIFNRFKMNIHYSDEWPFRSACNCGRMEIIKWLWEISNKTIDIRIMNDWAFNVACECEEYEVIEWLWQTMSGTPPRYCRLAK